jgi:hypothetical protein
MQIKNRLSNIATNRTFFLRMIPLTLWIVIILLSVVTGVADPDFPPPPPPGH